MKKTLTHLSIILIFLVIYFLQANFFTWFTIAGVKPNLFIILVIFISLFAGTKIGVVYGLVFGLFLDIVLGKTIGINTIMLFLIALLGGYFGKNFSKDSRATIILMVLSSSLLFEVGSYILSSVILKINVEVLYFIRILAIEIVYNIIITTILYTLIQTAGYKIEDIFRGNNILTRYF